MTGQTTLSDVRQAWETRDRSLADLIIALTNQRAPSVTAPEGAFTFQTFQRELRSYRWKPATARAAFHKQSWERLEGGEHELPGRVWLWQVIEELAEAEGAWEREMLLSVIARVPLKWGPWRAIKRLFKKADQTGDSELFGALTARLDYQWARGSNPGNEVGRKTMAYLVRRAWRHLRRIAESLPAAYADACVDVLRFYPADTRWRSTWVANHILNHGTKRYSRGGFRIWRVRIELKNRAWPDLWKRSPRPLFSLLERAGSEHAREYATTALTTDFRASLREVEPTWVARLIAVRSAKVDEFVIWLLGNVPRFEQGAFRQLGLHQPVLGLLDSPSQNARKYAAEYARTHARDLPLEELIRLANNDNQHVRKLSRDLLQARDPRVEVGLEAWGRLLGTRHAHDLAVASLSKHFGANELTPDWFRGRVLSTNRAVIKFATDLLPKIHNPTRLGPAWFAGLFDEDGLQRNAAVWALNQLAGMASRLDGEFLRRALLHPLARWTVRSWINGGTVKARQLSAEFLQTLAFHPAWESSSWVKELTGSQRNWARRLSYDSGLGSFARGLLGDVRQFAPGELGLEWLFELVDRSEDEYHGWAVGYLNKAFLPSDFAPDAGAAAAPSGPADLGGKTFLFTGKLKTMTRKEAQAKVAGANGKKGSSVTARLDYLVIGDEGSPLYGDGKKGSKQTKAEKLRDQGAAIQIISETSFLKMLEGGVSEASSDQLEAGCARLWSMAVEGKVDGQRARFARSYIRHHHEDLGLKLTERPVEDQAQIPRSFLSLERVFPLFSSPHQELRVFALELARVEFARWEPGIDKVVALAESPFTRVRGFTRDALLADDTEENRPWRVPPDRLTADAVYRFCESLDHGTRALGMELIARIPRLAIPQELFRLTESPDRTVRAFVVRTLWKLYRERGTTSGWQPPPPRALSELEKKKRKQQAARPAPELTPPRPEELPAPGEAMGAFLRRQLFGIPPARLPRRGRQGLKPLPARRAKIALIEVLRDLAIEDAGFAELLVPVLTEFMGSRGASERAACLVALTRIGAAHPAEETN